MREIKVCGGLSIFGGNGLGSMSRGGFGRSGFGHFIEVSALLKEVVVYG